MGVNERLWSSDLGTYSLSINSTGNYSVTSIAFCINAGVANISQAATSPAALERLKLGPGYKDTTATNSSDPDTKISPNTNEFLLEAILSQNASDTARDLIKSLWKPMIENHKTFSGSSWEYVSLSGTPGLGLYTRLAHAWGGAPTYILSEYVAGVRTAAGPAGYGYKEWLLRPKLGIDMGLKEAKAEVVTAFTQPLKVKWKVDGDTLRVFADAPVECTGVFELGNVTKVLAGSSSYHFEVKIV